MEMGDAAPAGYMPRVVDQQMVDSLRSSPAVAVEGPRACGKTWTGRRFANSVVRFDALPSTSIELEADPAAFLVGDTPRLLDEWHLAGGVWNAMRHACDDRALNGQFILAGSIRPTYTITDHSGAGRVARLRIRPMSLFESGDSTGRISLSGLLDGGPCRADPPESDLLRVAELVCRGGFPRFTALDPDDAGARLSDYLRAIAMVDLRGGEVSHDPLKMLALISSLARNEGTSASARTLMADTTNTGGPSDRDTVRRYLERLEEAFVIEPLPAWSTHLRSSATLRSTPKRYFADPSLAAAALRASPAGLRADLAALGLLFESLALRDLRVYAQAARADVRYYRDSKNLEADAIVTRGSGDWAAVEIKLGGTDAIASAVESLRRVRSRVDTQQAGEPSRLIVLTAAGRAFETVDDIAVVPVTLLGP
ncbi:MAG: ATP-binding protein [Acidimicrobiaceae bacterium]|nr:ATP-binding protein [Acidimicrobiaceae bacterium]